MNVLRRDFEYNVPRQSSSGSTYTSGEPSSTDMSDPNALYSFEDSLRSSRSSSSSNSRLPRRVRRPYTQPFRYPHQLKEDNRAAAGVTTVPPLRRACVSPFVGTDQSVLSGRSKRTISSRSLTSSNSSLRFSSDFSRPSPAVVSNFSEMENTQSARSTRSVPSHQYRPATMAAIRSRDSKSGREDRNLKVCSEHARHAYGERSRHGCSERCSSARSCARSTASVRSRSSIKSRISTSSSKLRSRGSSLERDISRTILENVSKQPSGGFWNGKDEVNEHSASVSDILTDLDTAEATIIDDESHFSSLMAPRGAQPKTAPSLPSIISEGQGSSSQGDSEMLEHFQVALEGKHLNSSFDAFFEQRSRVVAKDSSGTPDTSQETDAGSQLNSPRSQKPASPKTTENPFIVLQQGAMSPPIWSSSGESSGRGSQSGFGSKALSSSEWNASPNKSPSGVERMLRNSQALERPAESFFGASGAGSDGWTSFDENPFGGAFPSSSEGQWLDADTASADSPNSIAEFGGNSARIIGKSASSSSSKELRSHQNDIFQASRLSEI